MVDHSQKSSDSKIIQRILEGNINAFETLMDRYGDRVSRIVKRHVPLSEVEETTQEVFIRAYQSLAGFRGGDRFKSWLSTVAVRTCYDFWRRTYQSREVPMSSLSDRHREWLEEAMSEQAGVFAREKEDMTEAGEVLAWALERLTPEDRIVLELVYLEGLSGKEVAARLGWSVANVKVRSFRSRRRLEKLLRGVLEEEARISL